MGYKLYNTAKLEKVELESAKTELVSLNTSYATNLNAMEIFSNMPVIGKPAEPIDVSFAGMIRDLNLLAIDSGVRISSYSVVGSSGEAALSAATKPIAFGNGALISAPLSMRISYVDYDGMKRFLSSLPTQRIQVDNLEISGSSVIIGGSYLAKLR